MPTNTNEASIPANVNPEAIGEQDVTDFMNTLTAWAKALPRKQQSLLHLMLATAAASDNVDASEYLAGFPIPNPGDIVVAATGTATGAQSQAVVGPSAEAIAGDLTEGQAIGAAGGALARALLNSWGERQR